MDYFPYTKSQNDFDIITMFDRNVDVLILEIGNKTVRSIWQIYFVLWFLVFQN